MVKRKEKNDTKAIMVKKLVCDPYALSNKEFTQLYYVKENLLETIYTCHVDVWR